MFSEACYIKFSQFFTCFIRISQMKTTEIMKVTLCALIFINVLLQILGQVIIPKPLSVHILDTNFGGNAPNVTCKVYRKVTTHEITNNVNFELIATATTDADGRISQFLSSADYKFGTYRIWFGIGNYYRHSHGISTFFPQVQITYENKDGSASHIPLVISPYAISTYKGS